MLLAHHDFETRNALDLRKVGVHRYVEHPSMGVWVMSWCIGDPTKVPIRRWHPGDPDPDDLLLHIMLGGMVGVHNAIFERTVWNDYLRRRVVPHWPPLRIQQQDCTMSRAAVLGIPISLEICAQALGAKAKKDMEGNTLMMKMAKPRKVNADGTYEWWGAP